MTDAPAAPAGWYPRPDGTKRYWDGTAWLDIPAPEELTPAAAPDPAVTEVETAAADPEPVESEPPAPKARPRWLLPVIAAAAVIIAIIAAIAISANAGRAAQIEQVERVMLQSARSGEFGAPFQAQTVSCSNLGDRSDGQGQLECFLDDGTGLGYVWTATVDWETGDFIYRPSR